MAQNGKTGEGESCVVVVRSGEKIVFETLNKSCNHLEKKYFLGRALGQRG